MAENFSKEAIADGVRGRGSSLLLGALAGVLAAALGALLWMGVAVGLSMHIGIVAIGIGALVGFAIRAAGNGHTVVFGILGAVLTFAGCLGGEIISTLYHESSAQTGILDLLKTVDGPFLANIFGHMGMIDYVIYGIGIYEGYILSIRK